MENEKIRNPLFSIVIPTRNESADIANTLEACLGIDYEPKEIIVVDDSTDDTPSIVSKYASKGVRLVRRDRNSNGCCGARNLGMQEARGEFITLLNADDVPSFDFLKRILRHFEQGADYVVVQSAVRNCNNMWSRYIRAVEVEALATGQDPHWSEGFSCRSSAARTVGYIPGDFPVPFCRDWMLGATLKRAGFGKLVDCSIMMEHVAPNDFRSFWKNQAWRASMWAPSAFFFKKQSVMRILTKETLKTGWRFLRAFLILPHFAQALRHSKLLSGKSEEALSLLLVRYVQDAAFTVGAFKGIVNLTKSNMDKNK